MTVLTGENRSGGEQPGRARLGPALLWSYALSLGQFGIGGGLTFLLAAILNPQTFGLMVMAMVWISFILMLIHHATLPIIQQPDLGNRHFSAAFWAMLVGAVVVALLILAAGGPVAALNRTPELADVLRALALLVLIEATSAIPAAVLRRQMRFRALAIRGLVAEVAGGVVGISLALAGYGVWALVGQQYALSVVSALMLWLARPWPLRFGPVRAEIRQMRATAVKSVTGFFGYFVSLRTDALLLGVLFGPAALGLYRLATKITEMIRNLASEALSQVSLPDLAVLHREPDRFVARLSGYVHTSAVVAFPLFGLAAAVAEPALAILGPEWVDAAVPLRVLCLASAAWVVYSQLTTALMAAQRPGVEAAFNWLRALVLAGAMGLAAWLTWSADLPVRVMAIAIAVLAMETVMVALTWWVTFRRTLRASGRPVVVVMVPALVAGVAGAVAGWVAVGVAADHSAPVLAMAVGLVAGAVVAVPILILTDARVARHLRALRGRWRTRGDPDPATAQSEGP